MGALRLQGSSSVLMHVSELPMLDLTGAPGSVEGDVLRAAAPDGNQRQRISILMGQRRRRPCTGYGCGGGGGLHEGVVS